MGLKLRKEYSETYSREFLGESQLMEKGIEVVGATGCRTNPKDAFRISPMRLDNSMIETLTVKSI